MAHSQTIHVPDDYPIVKQALADATFHATEFRGQTTLIVEPRDLHRVMRFLRDDPQCDYNFHSDVVGVDEPLSPQAPDPCSPGIKFPASDQ